MREGEKTQEKKNGRWIFILRYEDMSYTLNSVRKFLSSSKDSMGSEEKENCLIIRCGFMEVKTYTPYGSGRWIVQIVLTFNQGSFKALKGFEKEVSFHGGCVVRT